MTIFGISIGTSRIGVSILKNGELFDRNVHDFQTIWSEEKLNKIINRFKKYLHKYPIDAIVVKIPPTKNHTVAMSRLIKKTERLAQEYYCEFDLMFKSELKGFTLSRSTAELIECTKRLYPELNQLHLKGRVTRYCYYKKLYEAVLTAHIYEERQRVRKLQKDNIKE